jgi:hypothetical protein
MIFDMPDLVWVEHADPLPFGTWQLRKSDKRTAYVRLDLSDEEIKRLRGMVSKAPEVKL